MPTVGVDTKEVPGVGGYVGLMPTVGVDAEVAASVGKGVIVGSTTTGGLVGLMTGRPPVPSSPLILACVLRTMFVQKATSSSSPSSPACEVFKAPM